MGLDRAKTGCENWQDIVRDMDSVHTKTLDECKQACIDDDGCTGFSWQTVQCEIELGPSVVQGACYPYYSSGCSYVDSLCVDTYVIELDSSAPTSPTLASINNGAGCNNGECCNATGTYFDDNGFNGGAPFDVYQSECRLTFTYDGVSHSGMIEGYTLRVDGWSEGTFWSMLNFSGVQFDDGGSWRKAPPNMTVPASTHAPTTAAAP